MSDSKDKILSVLAENYQLNLFSDSARRSLAGKIIDAINGKVEPKYKSDEILKKDAIKETGPVDDKTSVKVDKKPIVKDDIKKSSPKSKKHLVPKPKRPKHPGVKKNQLPRKRSDIIRPKKSMGIGSKKRKKQI